VTDVVSFTESVPELRRGWLLGELRWDWTVPETHSTGEERHKLDPQLTVLLDADLNILPTHLKYSSDAPLVRVNEDLERGGYTAAWGNSTQFHDWELAAAAVRTLIGSTDAGIG
jgi:hypothetical protein